MNTCFDSNTAFFRLNWNADQLAAAVPLCLHELYAIAHLGDAVRRAPANNASNRTSRRSRATGYLPDSALPARFRIL